MNYLSTRVFIVCTAKSIFNCLDSQSHSSNELEVAALAWFESIKFSAFRVVNYGS